MNEEPLVSIITPSFNQGFLLERTVLSVLKQDYPLIEFIIMDGGSSDNSIEILESYTNKIEYWESKADNGQAHAINKGLRRAKGEILGWVNSDDVLLPGAVQRVVNTFREHPEVDVVYGRLERINTRGELIPTPILPKDTVTFNKKLVIGECVVNQPGSFWRRRIMEKIGSLNEELNYALDYEYWIRMAIGGAAFMRLPVVVAQFRLSEKSKTVGDTAAMAEEQLSVLDELLERSDLPLLLELEPEQIQQKARKAYSRIGLHAFYGSVKRKDWRKALCWLGFAFRNEPGVFLERRWIGLGWASVKRRIMHRKH